MPVEVRRHRCGRRAVRRGIEVRPEPSLGDDAVTGVEHQADVLVAHRETHRRAGHSEGDVVAAARRDRDRRVAQRPAAGLVACVDRDDAERRADEREAAHGVGGVDEPQPDGRSGCDASPLLAIARAEQRTPGDRVRERDDVCTMRRLARRDDERSVETALDLAGRVLVRVVPVRSGLRDPEAVDVRAARPHGVLRHARDAVLGIRHVDAVPVDRHAFVDVAVH